MTSNHIWKEKEIRICVFLLIENENDNKNIIAYTILQKTVADKSAYKKTSLAI